MSLSNEPMSTPSSSCSCWLPAGWYGSGGWHMRPVTEQDAAALGELSWTLKNYIGTPLAVEQCPLYQAAALKAHAAKQTEAAASATRPGRLRA